MQRFSIDKILPLMATLRGYNRAMLLGDVSVAVIVSIMLIPQAIAYGMLAGMPPQAGLYASLLPLLGYALFGKSAALSVGPFAITSIMTASALNNLYHGAPLEVYVIGAALLALVSGLMLVAFGILRLGFLSNFISFPVVTGFISASALVIATSQISAVLGLAPVRGVFIEPWLAAWQHFADINIATVITAICAGLFLKLMPKLIAKAAQKIGIARQSAQLLGKTAPLLMVVLAIVVSYFANLQQYGVAVVGAIPSGLPSIQLPDWQLLNLTGDNWLALGNSALIISIIGFVTSLSTAQAFAVKERQRISPNQEAVALGAANIASGLSGGFPVTASLSRSAVAFEAGAKTPAASAFTAIGIALSCLYLTPLLYYLPVAALAAMIILAIMSLFDYITIARTLRYSWGDFLPLALTLALTLFEGLDWGLIGGVVLSLLIYLYRSANPHWALLGLVPQTQHFRNLKRHQVVLLPQIISLRVDASLYFANAKFLEDKINQLVAEHPQARHLIFNCAAINGVDISALQSLFVINQSLLDANIQLHLAEVKGPVMDTLKKSQFLELLGGEVFLTHYQAWQKLSASL